MVIHLRSYHRKVRKFKHPLLNNVTPVSEEQAKILVDKYLADRSEENKGDLILSMLSVVRHLVGRYLANWPTSRKYMEDMVSEGVSTVVKSVDNLNSEILGDRSIIKLMSQRICRDIESMLYDLGSLACPHKRTQERHAQLGKESPYPIVEANLTVVESVDSSSKEAQDLIDAEDAISVMSARLQLDADLLKPEYRNLTAEEAGARLGVHHSTILRRRAKLRSLYKVDFGG